MFEGVMYIKKKLTVLGQCSQRTEFMPFRKGVVIYKLECDE